MTNILLKAITALTILFCCSITSWAANPVVRLDISDYDTIDGSILIELFTDDAPVTVANILDYTDAGFYDGLIFHRVIEDFMIQGGGFDPNLSYQQPDDPIVNESNNGLSNLRGTIAMARTTEPDSATSQFYINHTDNLFLDRSQAADGVGYCVFGRVIEGMDLVDTIAQTPTDWGHSPTHGWMGDVPDTAVVIVSASRATGADLTGRFDTIDLPAPLVPGDKITAPLIIANSGNQPVKAKITINLYASTDQALDESDGLIAQLTNQSVKLDPGQDRTYKIKTTIPHEALPGSYYLLADIDTENTVTEYNESNNTAVSSAQSDIVLQFGTFDGRKVSKLIITDDSGITITIVLTGDGWGEIDTEGQLLNITLHDTNVGSSLKVLSGDGPAVPLGDIDIPNGSLKAITAKTCNLHGNITIAGTLTKLILADAIAGIPNGHLITILGQPATTKTSLSIQLDSAHDLSISAPNLPLKAVTAVQWLDSDGVADTLTTPSLAKLTIRGDKKASPAVAGDFEADLNLTGNTSAKAALKTARIAGRLREVAWHITGNVGNIAAAALVGAQLLIGADQATGSADDFPTSAQFSFKALTLTDSQAACFDDSTVAAWSIGSVRLATGSAQPTGLIEYHEIGKASGVPIELLLPVP